MHLTIALSNNIHVCVVILTFFFIKDQLAQCLSTRMNIYGTIGLFFCYSVIWKEQNWQVYQEQTYVYQHFRCSYCTHLCLHFDNESGEWESSIGNNIISWDINSCFVSAMKHTVMALLQETTHEVRIILYLILFLWDSYIPNWL